LGEAGESGWVLGVGGSWRVGWVVMVGGEEEERETARDFEPFSPKFHDLEITGEGRRRRV